jgi:hypothetical protein
MVLSPYASMNRDDWNGGKMEYGVQHRLAFDSGKPAVPDTIHQTRTFMLGYLLRHVKCSGERTHPNTAPAQ